MDTRLIHLEETASTQDAAAAAYEGVPLLVVADRQTRGRGRHSNVWESAPRSLAMSLAIQPGWPLETWPRLTLVAGVSVALLVAGSHLKWPNDVLIGDAKVAGILAEARGDFLVIGVGVNLWWPEAPDGYAAIFQQDPGPDFGVELASEIAASFRDRVHLGPVEWGIDTYRDLCDTIGEDISWEPDGTGTAVGVADSGSLIVSTEKGTEELVSGAVRHIRKLG